MATLEGQTIAGSYKDLLQVSNSNSGVDATARAVSDGEGTATLLYVSTTEVYNPGTGGASNTAFGKNAGDALASGGECNVFIGEEAGSDMVTGTNNIAIGCGAFDAADNGEDNCIAIGNNALGNLNHASSVRNIAIGSGAGDGMGTLAGSIDNVFIGYDAGGGTWATAVSSYNVGIGNYVMDAAMNAAENNTAVGYAALGALTEGDQNVAIGRNAGLLLTTGENNVLVGDGSGATLAAAMSNNVLVGRNAGTAINHADANGTVAIGHVALTALTSGIGNTAVGYQALDAAVTSDHNTAVGFQALSAENTDGAGRNTAVGYQSGLSITSGTANAILGWQAGDALVGGAANVILGDNAGSVTTDVDKAIIIGQSAGDGNMTAAADGTIAIGYLAGASLTQGERNTILGYEAVRYPTTGSDDNVVIGYQAMGGNFTTNLSYQNISIGNYTMKGVLNAALNNVAVGHGALNDLTEGDNNICIGTSAGANITDVSNNTLIGYQAGITASTGMGNCVAVGYQALNDNNNIDNVAVGYQAGASLTGQHSVLIGHQAGVTTTAVTSGDHCICIGSQAHTSSGGAQNQIVIGYNASGTGDQYSVIGNSSSTRLYAADDTGATLYAGSATVQTSDRRIKENVKDISFGLDFVNQLKPVEYNKKQPVDYDDSLKENLHWYKNGTEPRVLDDTDKSKLRVGFIAQDVGDVLKDLGFDDNNDIVDVDLGTTQQHLAYSKIVAPLVKAVQELSAKVKALEDAQ